MGVEMLNRGESKWLSKNNKDSFHNVVTRLFFCWSRDVGWTYTPNINTVYKIEEPVPIELE